MRLLALENRDEKNLKIRKIKQGRLGGSAVSPSAHVVTPGSRDRVPHWAPCREPASPPCLCLCLSLCVSHE